MKLTDKAISALKGNKRVRAMLQLEFNKTEWTINRYIQENDIMLTTAQALVIIKRETGLTDSEILETSATKVA